VTLRNEKKPFWKRASASASKSNVFSFYKCVVMVVGTSEIGIRKFISLLSNQISFQTKLSFSPYFLFDEGSFKGLPI
jgi:hypothetical protein